MKSWKTTLGGLLAALGIGMRQNAKLAPYADFVEFIGVAALGLAARDNKVTSEQAGASKPESGNGLRNIPLIALGLSLALMTGCARFSMRQADREFEDPVTKKPVRETTTYASGYTLFSAKNSLANWKASQTGKTQGASVGTLGQESSGTNTVELVRQVGNLAETIVRIWLSSRESPTPGQPVP